MFRTVRRLLAATTSLVLVLGSSPVAATDPTPAPALEPQSPRTVHAEMLEAHAADAIGLTPGGAPAPMEDRIGTQADDGQGAITALPNGLRREVYGYLPYWALSSSLLQHLNYDLVSTIAYFGVPAQANGTLLKSGTAEQMKGWQGWTSSAMTGVINKAHANGVQVHLTVTMMAWTSSSAMSTLLNNATYRQSLANEIAATVKARNADGVNLDFEPVPNSLQSQYVTFVRQVKAALRAAGAGSYLTVAATGGAASWDEGYDLPALVASGAADAIMAMGYDFNWGGSARAGGVAPIDSPYVLDVRSAMDDYVSKVPAAKLIWGVPYYGRAWTTKDSSRNSLTCRTATVCPGVTTSGVGRTWLPRYVDAREAVATHGRLWDPTGQVPWYRYWSSAYRTWVQGYYDDAQSLGAKYDLVSARGLRGVGVWHLLMDVERPELWNELAKNFASLPFSDIANSPFLEDIVWLADANITNGCGNGRYCPTASVNRDQMASFLARALALPSATKDYFTDDTGSQHEADINRVAEAGITIGCGGTNYCPLTSVKRDQMASFLARGLGLAAATTDHFTDDEGSPHEADINRIADAGISLGCGGGRFCPDVVVTREQMAAFLHRAIAS